MVLVATYLVQLTHLYYSFTTGGIMSNAQEVSHEAVSNVARLYVKPAIVHELKLETRAGSPITGPILVDPLGVDPVDSQ